VFVRDLSSSDDDSDSKEEKPARAGSSHAHRPSPLHTQSQSRSHSHTPTYSSSRQGGGISSRPGTAGRRRGESEQVRKPSASGQPADGRSASLVIVSDSEDSFSDTDYSSSAPSTPRRLSPYTRAIAVAWIMRMRSSRKQQADRSTISSNRPSSSTRQGRGHVVPSPFFSPPARKYGKEEAAYLRGEYERLGRKAADQLEEIDALREERQKRFQREKEQRLLLIRLKREKGERERKLKERQGEIERIKAAVAASEKAEVLADAELMRLRQDRERRKVMYKSLMSQISQLKMAVDDTHNQLPLLPSRPSSAAHTVTVQNMQRALRMLNTSEGQSVVGQVLKARHDALEAERQSIQQLITEYPATFRRRADFFLSVSGRVNDSLDGSRRLALHEGALQSLMWKRKCLLALIEYKHTESKQKCAYSLFKTWKELEERVAVADSDKRIAEKRREDIASIGVFASKALEGVGKLSTSAKKALAHIRKHISSYIRRKRNQPSPDSIQHVGELEELLSESHSIGGRELRQRATLIQLKVRHESEGDMSTALLTARADDSTFIANISSGLGPLAAPQFPSALHLDVEREMKQRESIGKLREEVDNLDGALRTAEKQSEEVEVARKGKLAQPVQNSVSWIQPVMFTLA